jgi:signal transduction histidine kinase
MKLQRFDTLFLRLFVLMWVTLVASHLLAFAVSIPITTGHESPATRWGWRNLQALPSLPPGSLIPGSPAGDAVDSPPRPVARPEPGPPPEGPTRRGGSGEGPGLPPATLWTDYALRALLIGLGAWLGARWIAGPTRRLADAARQLSQGLEQGRQPPVLDEHQGTVEVRETARVFNHMTRQLQEQFDQRSLHMAAISHDLRTPLTRLRLRIEPLAGKVAHSASADIREMDELINASLAVMREQSGGTDPAVVDLAALLQSMVDDMQEQGHAVELHRPGDERAASSNRVQVRVQPASLRRTLGNLISNALRYGHRASIQLTPTDNGVTVTVDDEGPGIAAEHLERVFQPWVRLPGENRSQGNGLGLAIARDLVAREGGTLSLSNRPGGGLRATLTLPSA